MKDDFDKNKLSGKEIEQNFDEIVEAVRPLFEEWHKTPHLLNTKRMGQLYSCYYAMKELMKGTDAIVTCDFDEEDFLYSGVEVMAKVLKFTDYTLLAKAAEFADDIAINSCPHGMVSIVFGFGCLAMN